MKIDPKRAVEVLRNLASDRDECGRECGHVIEVLVSPEDQEAISLAALAIEAMEANQRLRAAGMNAPERAFSEARRTRDAYLAARGETPSSPDRQSPGSTAPADDTIATTGPSSAPPGP